MPKVATFLSIDFGSLLGPFFFTLAWNILFPTIVVSLVYEKEVGAPPPHPTHALTHTPPRSPAPPSEATRTVPVPLSPQRATTATHPRPTGASLIFCP